ncbi:uncharacterized protein F5147DRAFT_720158 [Suillus discolor]|uniref:Uncharacterized protein n=1 Tax=Suillus discolor TaxID=1912936 RepID=A0A9P7EX61_9AGAM|nr:uncharacterized protein F5147DRAFT_720158 [Suillus discolor]KAG2094022.1 hypothetical protein F5147DRAFT_720158 [Suillus discolor]
MEDLLSTGTNIMASRDNDSDLGIQHTPCSSLNDQSFLEVDATRCPGQFGGLDELFFNGMEADVESSSMGGAHPHSSVNALLARLSSFVHRSSPENDAPDAVQQKYTPSLLDPRVLLARLGSLFPQSQLSTGEANEPHLTTPLSSHLDPPIIRLSSLFRSQPHTDEEIGLAQRPSCHRVVEVAAIRDKQSLVVARGPNFMKAKRAYDEQQTQLHGPAHASSSHTQPASASTSATPSAPGTTVTQPPYIPWWAQIVLFLCCASSPHANGR